MSILDIANKVGNFCNAYIQVIPPGIGRIDFQYNPQKYTVTRTASWQETTQASQRAGGKAQFMGVTSRELEAVEILFDTFAIPPNPPEVGILILEEAMKPTVESVAAGTPMPSLVSFGWGENIVFEQAYIQSMTVEYQRFLVGAPVRAKVTVKLKEVSSPLPGTNPTSGGIATRKTHTVIEGDTLASIAYKELGNPTKWRALAEANGIDDPLRLQPGTVLLVPEPAEVDALA